MKIYTVIENPDILYWCRGHDNSHPTALQLTGFACSHLQAEVNPVLWGPYSMLQCRILTHSKIPACIVITCLEPCRYTGIVIHHSHPQRLCSFWSVPKIVTSRKIQFSEHAQSNHFIFSANQIYPTWLWVCAEWWEVHEMQTTGVEPSKRSWFLVLTKRNVASGDEYVISTKKLTHQCMTLKIF